jgi:hypothetical protein
VRFAAAFNLSRTETVVTLDVGSLGIPASGGSVRELWSGIEVTARPVAVQSHDARGVAPGSAAVDLSLPAHGCALLAFVPASSH